MGFGDETLAYDADSKWNIDTRDVTLAYHDDAKGNICTKDVTLTYGDHINDKFVSD